LEEKIKYEIEQKNILIEKLSKSEHELKEFFTIIELSPISVVITDENANIRYANKTVLNLTGYTIDELIGQNPRILKSGLHAKEFYEKMWNDLKNGNEWKGEIQNIKKNKEVYWERSIIIPIKNEKGEIYSFLALKEDITESKKQADIIKYQAERDALTGICNRRAGIYTLENIINDSKKNEKKAVICFIDLNNLKYTNDNFGHEAGDDMIKTFSKVVKNCLRDEDYFFRFGGDEFIIIFKSCTVEIAEKIWTRIKTGFDKINNSNEKKFILSASHGIVEYNSNEYLTIEEFIVAADKKMYEEKKISKIK